MNAFWSEHDDSEIISNIANALQKPAEDIEDGNKTMVFLLEVLIHHALRLEEDPEIDEETLIEQIEWINSKKDSIAQYVGKGPELLLGYPASGRGLTLAAINFSTGIIFSALVLFLLLELFLGIGGSENFFQDLDAGIYEGDLLVNSIMWFFALILPLVHCKAPVFQALMQKVVSSETVIIPVVHAAMEVHPSGKLLLKKLAGLLGEGSRSIGPHAEVLELINCLGEQVEGLETKRALSALLIKM